MVRDIEFEIELKSFISKAFNDEDKYIILCETLVPNNEDAKIVNYGKKIRSLPDGIPLRF